MFTLPNDHLIKCAGWEAACCYLPFYLTRKLFLTYFCQLSNHRNLSDLINLPLSLQYVIWSVTPNYKRPYWSAHPPRPEYRLPSMLLLLVLFKVSSFCPAIRLISGTALLPSWFRISAPAVLSASVFLVAGRQRSQEFEFSSLLGFS